VPAGMIGFCLPENKAQFKQKIAVFSYVYNILPYLTAFDSLILFVACRSFITMETFLENDPLAKKKILDMKEDKLVLAA
jgi:hypothetical protein